MPTGLKIKDFPLLAKTVYKLGVGNVAYVVWYRFTLKSGLRRLWFKQQHFANATGYFVKQEKRADYPEAWEKKLLKEADKITKGQIRYYAYHWKDIGNPPHWFLNPFNGKQYPDKHKHWTELPDFHPQVGDIKNVWEASRFEWVVTLARAYAVTGHKKYLETLNDWIGDWAKENSFNTGPNWKCGQEASIRVFNLLNASCILKQWDNPSDALTELIYLHLKRISGNILYAIAQNNNHGTSEAAALFIGGCWLEKHSGKYFTEGKRFGKKGRKWLENRVKKLIAPQGSFSQHSVTYHRVLLDTLCFAEHWRSILDQPRFSETFYEKARAATNWLWMLTDEISGDAPNLGANDGAFFLNTHSCAYRNFRPSNQLAHALFLNERRYDEGPWDEPLFWFGIKKKGLKKTNPERKSMVLDQAYAIMKNGNSWALFRLPDYRFRPSHNDVFHFDLWVEGKNVLCDSGTYSYHPQKQVYDFRSVEAHNTACFDNFDQMPRIGRFLLTNWIKPQKIYGPLSKEKESFIEGSYFDHRKNLHYRKISWSRKHWVIEDQFSGKYKRVKIGFNLNQAKCQIKGTTINCNFGDINVINPTGIKIEPCWISRIYGTKEEGKRISVEAGAAGQITTTITIW